MNLQGRIELTGELRSASQIARVVTEDWCKREMYCAACDAERLRRMHSHSRACDFTCETCQERFELKSSRHPFGNRILDSAYKTMITAIQSDRTPNLLLMQYSSSFTVVNLFMVSRYFFSQSAVEERPPLGPGARRSGWVGCNIRLDRISSDGKIGIVTDGIELPRTEVRAHFQQTKALGQLRVPERGWTVDVLTAVRGLGRKEFTLDDAYSRGSYLAKLHPNNRHIREKIRQQLQVIRDLGFVQFLGGGRYRFRE